MHTLECTYDTVVNLRLHSAVCAVYYRTRHQAQGTQCFSLFSSKSQLLRVPREPGSAAKVARARKRAVIARQLLGYYYQKRKQYTLGREYYGNIGNITQALARNAAHIVQPPS